VVGETVAEPAVATEPTEGLIETDVAPVVFHESVADPPLVIEVGDAVKLEMVGAEPATTDTVTVAVTEPFAFVAVSVYVVFVVGETVAEPAVATEPTEGLIETDVAPVVFQESVAD